MSTASQENIAKAKAEIENYLTGKKTIMLGTIAHDLSINELEVAKALPSDMISFANKEDFEEIWQELSTWAKTTFIVQHLGSVIEISTKINTGKFGHGYYNLSGDAPLHGHLAIEDLASIAFLSLPFMGLESHSVVFFNDKGEVKFSIYVGRENKVLIPEARTSFLAMQKKYA